jgi:hypothetical protein
MVGNLGVPFSILPCYKALHIVIAYCNRVLQTELSIERAMRVEHLIGKENLAAGDR